MVLASPASTWSTFRHTPTRPNGPVHRLIEPLLASRLPRPESSSGRIRGRRAFRGRSACWATPGSIAGVDRRGGARSAREHPRPGRRRVLPRAGLLLALLLALLVLLLVLLLRHDS